MHARAGWASTVPGADPEASTVPCLSCGCEGPGRSGDDRKFALENKAAAAVGAFVGAEDSEFPAVSTERVKQLRLRIRKPLLCAGSFTCGPNGSGHLRIPLRRWLRTGT